MTSNADLPQQPNTQSQQAPPMKTKSNHSWNSFSILLIIVNFLFGGLIIYKLIFYWLLYWRLDYMLAGFMQSILNFSPFLLLVAITDIFTVIAHLKKRPPPWKTFLAPLVIGNIIFFSFVWWALNQTAGGVAGIIIIPVAFILLIFDTIVILSYIHTRSPQSKAQS